MSITWSFGCAVTSILFTISVTPIERFAKIGIGAGKRVVVYASTADCSVSVYGLEQSVA